MSEQDEVLQFIEAANIHFTSDPRWTPKAFNINGDFYDLWLEATDNLLRLCGLAALYERSLLAAPETDAQAILSGGFVGIMPAVVGRRVDNVVQIRPNALYISEINDLLKREMLVSPVTGMDRLLTLAARYRRHPDLTPDAKHGLKVYVNAAYGVLARKQKSKLSLVPHVGFVALSVRDRMSRLFRMFPRDIYYIDTDTVFAGRKAAPQVFAAARVLFDAAPEWDNEEGLSAIFIRKQKYTIKNPDGSLYVHGHKNPVDTPEAFDAWEPRII